MTNQAKRPDGEVGGPAKPGRRAPGRRGGPGLRHCLFVIPSSFGLRISSFAAALIAAAVLLSVAGPAAGAPAARPGAAPPAAPVKPPAELTDEDVLRAIAKGREYLINLQNADGSFTRETRLRGCYSTLIFMTLAYMGEHPNRPVMEKALQFVLSLDVDRDFFVRQGYAVPIRVMGLCYLHDRLSGEKQALARQKIKEDLVRIIQGQHSSGGWRYRLQREGYDFSVSQWPILAFYEAGRIGVEFPPEPLAKAVEFYYAGQRPDGGWSYQFGGRSYGSMTAAGLASLYILEDLLRSSSGCPCEDGRSRTQRSIIERRQDVALEWLVNHFDVTRNPGWIFETNFDEKYYWLYSLERVGIATGHKHLAGRNWYREGAAFIVGQQRADGSWQEIDPRVRTHVPDWAGGGVPDTCFALLFLYKGRAPLLFNKLRHDGLWNPHRRDVANLTRYAELAKEQLFHWQVVDIAAPLQEWHDAPVLFLCAETPPAWGPKEKEKLRRFTDTGGTILVEASCGARAVREWFTQLAAEVWPEWPLRPVPWEHLSFKEPYPMKDHPEVFGIDDGIRTVLFYAPDDVSCPWHLKAYTAKEYLFHWGVNLFTYATDRAPLRAKLASGEAAPSERLSASVRPGRRRALRVARVRHGGDWFAGANYGALTRLAGYLKTRFNMFLAVEEPASPPVTRGGVAPADLVKAEAPAPGAAPPEARKAQPATAFDVAYITGSRPPVFEPADRQALQRYVDAGGFLWVEAARGSEEFDKGLRALAEEMGWTLRPIPKDHPLMTGRMGTAQGYRLTEDVAFRRALQVPRAAKPWAELVGIYAPRAEAEAADAPRAGAGLAGGLARRVVLAAAEEPPPAREPVLPWQVEEPAAEAPPEEGEKESRTPDDAKGPGPFFPEPPKPPASEPPGEGEAPAAPEPPAAAEAGVLIGLYSPFDLMFSMSPYEAGGLRGYRPADAGAVVLNLVFYLTDYLPAARDRGPAPGSP